MKWTLAIGLITLVLVGCDRQALFERSIPQDDVEFSREYVERLRAGDFESVESIIDPALRDGSMRARLEQIAGFFPQERPSEVRPVGVQTVIREGVTEINTSFQYSYPDQWLLVSVQQTKHGQDSVVTGVHVQPIRGALESTHQFTFADKGVFHYLILMLAIAVPLLIIVALVLCIKTPGLRGKWLWVIAILPGFAQLTLNWTDGGLQFIPYAVQLLGVSVIAHSPYSPWMLSVSIPVGAIVFLVMRGLGKLSMKGHPADSALEARQADVFRRPGR